jgi:predicted enzyme related to lactoylglutathione lyase
MPTNLSYVIQFVSDMDKAIGFYRDSLGLPLKFQSPDWSELVMGPTTLAPHRPSPENPAGKVQLGFHVPDLQAFYREMTAKGFVFTQPPTLEAGSRLARFLDSEGTEFSVGQG